MHTQMMTYLSAGDSYGYGDGDGFGDGDVSQRKQADEC